MTQARPADLKTDSRAPRAPVRRIASWIAYVLVRLAAVAVVWFVLLLGFNVRSAAWNWSAPARFTGDIRNAFNQGSRVLDAAKALKPPDEAQNAPVSWGALLRAYLARFDTVVREASAENYSLDYTPARLLIASIWVRHIHQIDPQAAAYRDEFAAPLVRFNTACELAAALFMFLVVRHWSRRPLSEQVLQTPAIFGRRDVPWILGIAAASVLWMNPAILVEAHMWPQWDVWIIPFYLAAMWLASTEYWFAAGAVIAIGAMFKGQILMVAPVLLIWPLFGGRWSATMLAALGFCIACAVMASPWLARNEQAWLWIGAVGLLSCVMAATGRWSARHRRGWPLWGIVPIAAVILRPFEKIHPNSDVLWPLLLLTAVILTPWIARHLSISRVMVWVATIVAGSIILSATTFAGTWSWLSVGFEFPTRHFLDMGIGGPNNLAVLLGERFGWHVGDIVFTIPSMFHHNPIDVTMKALLISIYAIAILLCGLGASLHSRRNDPRTMIALAAPWVLMFALLPQLHERYLIWGAAISGVAIASSPGMTLMQLLVIVASITSAGWPLLTRLQAQLPGTFNVVHPMHPDIGWMVMLIAATYLLVAVVPRRRVAQAD